MQLEAHFLSRVSFCCANIYELLSTFSNTLPSLQLNTYQVVLAMDGQTGYILFLYKDLQWTTSDACGGTGGAGSTLPEAGISAGDGMRSTALPFSGTSSILSLSQISSAGVPGLFILPSGDGKSHFRSEQCSC